MKKVFFWIKGIIFLCIAALTICVVNVILLPKYMNDSQWPTTATFTQFYLLEDNSVDVLFLGSSHAASAFNPQVVYDRENITSYNLASEQQNLLVSYYWLKEALATQQPEAVVLDVLMLFDFITDEPLNTEEAMQRKSIDFMKWSANKVEAVHDICTYDEEQDELSYYLTNIRFHERYKSLERNDFRFLERLNDDNLYGFAALYGKASDYKWFTPFYEQSTDEIAEPNELMLQYMDKITELCRDKGIRLYLTKTPFENWTREQHNFVKQYAGSNDIEFIDFNEKKTYDECGYDFVEENDDGVHVNIWGAERLSRYMAEKLKDDGLESSENSRYEVSRTYYASVMNLAMMSQEKEPEQFVRRLRDDDHLTFMIINGDIDERIFAITSFNHISDHIAYHYGKVLTSSSEDCFDGYVGEAEVHVRVDDDMVMVNDEIYMTESKGKHFVVIDPDNGKIIMKRCIEGQEGNK